MSALDWIITLVPLALVLAAGIASSRLVRGVADFMSASRSAGRYLLCIANGELQAGAVVFVASFEVFSKGGIFCHVVAWLNSLAVLLLSITGFVTYRFRETRAMDPRAVLRDPLQQIVPPFRRCAGLSRGHPEFRRDSPRSARGPWSIFSICRRR